MKKQEYPDYLLKNSIINKETNCWEWTSTIGEKGYGVSRRNTFINCDRRAHRLSYTIFISIIPSGLCVCHHCDNRECINPNHLFIGTIDDNNKDMTKKGRNRNGQLGKPGTFLGKKHTQNAKDKIGKATSIAQQGKNNSQYGTCWIYKSDLKKNKKVSKIELEKWVKKGWIAGRNVYF